MRSDIKGACLLLSAVTIWNVPSSACAGDNHALIDKTKSKIAERFAIGGRYVIGQETPQHLHPYCKEYSSGNGTNDLVTVYAEGIKGTDAKLLECDYPFPNHDPRHGWVIVVAATVQNIAERIVGACDAVARHALHRCVDAMMSKDWKAPWGSNSFIFPVTGFVREPCDGGENLIGFRHGITIQYGPGSQSNKNIDYCLKEAKQVAWQREVGLTHPTYEVFDIGRLAAVSRETIRSEGTFEKKVPLMTELDSFQAYVSDNEICAIRTNYDRLMVIKAGQLMNLPIPRRKPCVQ